uniref:Vitellogenin domain-containing protein n=1 Tax=Plectus sambesii TaxID=2011161 RepID=A0A914V471_9BILA
MRLIFPITFLCVIVLAMCESNESVEAVEEEVSATSTPSSDPYTVRLLTFEYEFESHTELSERDGKNVGNKKMNVKAKYGFDILHHDPAGHILTRYRLLECLTGWCDYDIPDLYVDVIQGGNNLQGVYVGEDKPATWNILLAAATSIVTPALSGEGDVQTAVTPYGICVSKFGRPADKRFTRHTYDCNIRGERNHSLIPLTTQSYEQKVEYLQNTKVDADIVEVTSVETLKLAADIHAKWSMEAKTTTKLTMLNRTQLILEPYCQDQESGAECVKRRFKAKLLGTNWADILKNLDTIRPQHAEPTFTTSVRKYREHLFPMGDSHTCEKHSSMFGGLVQSAAHATLQELETVIKDPENDIVLPALADVLAATGTNVAHKVAKTTLAAESPELLEKYVVALAQTTRITDWLLEDLQKWLESDTLTADLRPAVAFTLASLLKRHCSTSASYENACDTGKDEAVNKFVAHVTQCEEADEPCILSALITLRNVGTAVVLPFAEKFICTKSNVSANGNIVAEAVRLVATVSPKHYEAELISNLLRVFRNTCPLEVDSTAQSAAAEALLFAVNTHQSVATYLLRSLEQTPSKSNYELLAYFYALVDELRATDESFKDKWTHLRSFKVFRNNYNQRAIPAFSTVFRGNMAKLPKLQSSFGVKVQFVKNLFKRSLFDLTMTTGKRKTNSLLTLALNTNGLESLVGVKDASDLPSVPNDDKPYVDPSAGMQLAFFGSAQKPVSFFEGQGELMSAVWGASGQSIKAYEGNAVLRQYKGTIPLLSGLSLSLDLLGRIISF